MRLIPAIVVDGRSAAEAERRIPGRPGEPCPCTTSRELLEVGLEFGDEVCSGRSDRFPLSWSHAKSLEGGRCSSGSMPEEMYAGTVLYVHIINSMRSSRRSYRSNMYTLHRHLNELYFPELLKLRARKKLLSVAVLSIDAVSYTHLTLPTIYSV